MQGLFNLGFYFLLKSYILIDACHVFIHCLNMHIVLQYYREIKLQKPLEVLSLTGVWAYPSYLTDEGAAQLGCVLNLLAAH